MRLEKDNAIRLFNCEAPGSEGIKLEEIFYEEKMEDGRIKKVVQHVLNPEMVPYIPSSSILSPNSISIIIYGKPHNSNNRIMNYFGYIGELYRHIQEKRGTVKCNWVNEYGKKTSTEN